MTDATTDVVVAERCSKWYGPVLGVSDVTWRLGAGVIGLLGPNGAGKSTLMKLMAGLVRPSRGTLTVLGGQPFEDPAVRRRIGYSPEHENTYDHLTALELVTSLAHLAGVPRKDADGAARCAIEAMGMTAAMHRRVRGFSKGMRQRTKLAAIDLPVSVLSLAYGLWGIRFIGGGEIVSVAAAVVSLVGQSALAVYLFHRQIARPAAGAVGGS